MPTWTTPATVPTLDHGTYTPSLTNGANMTSSTAYVCQWMRVGNVVTVSGKVDVTLSAGGGSAVSITLPVASNFTDESQAGGSFRGSISTASGAAYADTTNDRIFLMGTYATGSQSIWFTATYLVA